jgi:AAA domain
MNQLPVQRASELSIDSASLTHRLVQGLWSDQAVGILGGEPKCCKSFLALDLAVSLASGAPCVRRFTVRRTGPVLLFPAGATALGSRNGPRLRGHKIRLEMYSTSDLGHPCP